MEYTGRELTGRREGKGGGSIWEGSWEGMLGLGGRYEALDFFPSSLHWDGVC